MGTLLNTNGVYDFIENYAEKHGLSGAHARQIYLASVTSKIRAGN